MTAALLEAMPEAGGEVLRTDGTYVFRNTDYQQLHTRLCGIVPEYAELENIEDGGWLKVFYACSKDGRGHCVGNKKLDRRPLCASCNAK